MLFPSRVCDEVVWFVWHDPPALATRWRTYAPGVATNTGWNPPSSRRTPLELTDTVSLPSACEIPSSGVNATRVSLASWRYALMRRLSIAVAPRNQLTDTAA